MMEAELKSLGPSARRLVLRGVLDETFDPGLSEGLKEGLVLIDLDGVTRVTSFGVKRWMAFISELSTAEYVGLLNCRPAFVTQLNMVRNFIGEAEVISVYLPYLSPETDESFDVLADLRTQYGPLAAGQVPAIACPGAPDVEAEFDDLPEVYLAWVLRRPPPQVPPELRVHLDGVKAQTDDRTTVRLDVVEPISAVWLKGPLRVDRTLRRRLGALQGIVLLEMSAVTDTSQEDLLELLRWLHGLGLDEVYLGRVPRHLWSLLPGLEKEFPEHVASVNIGVTGEGGPMEISHRTVLQIRRGERIRAGSSTVTPEELDANPDFKSLPTLAGMPPEELEHYLLRRRSLKETRRAVRLPTERFQSVRLLARGGMAEVYLARQLGPEGFDRRVALKRILSDFVANPEFVDMFLNEARLAARISHPNVVQILDLGQDGEDFFIAMEYVEGWDLARLLRAAAEKGRRVPVQIACYIAAEVCNGLQAAHSVTHDDGSVMAIVHRDVSPHNILVSRAGKVKLSDFGIAKAVQSFSTEEEGSLRGKLAYMAPEQAFGRELTPRADLFSAGAVLFQMVFGELPFGTPSSAARLYVLSNERPWQRTLDAYAEEAGDLREVLGRCLAADPTQRPSSADELSVQLMEIVARLGGVVTSQEVASWASDLVGDQDEAEGGEFTTSSVKESPKSGLGGTQELEIDEEDIKTEVELGGRPPRT